MFFPHADLLQLSALTKKGLRLHDRVAGDLADPFSSLP